MTINWADPAQIEDELDEAIAQTDSSQEDEEIVDSSTHEFVDETDVVIKTPKTKVWKRGEVKLPIIGVICLGGVFSLYGMMKGGSDSFQSANGGNVITPSNTRTPQTQTPANTQGYDPEKAKYKTQAALGTQSQELQNLVQQEQQKASAPPPESVVNPTIPIQTTNIPTVPPEPRPDYSYSPPPPRYSYNSSPSSVPIVQKPVVASAPAQTSINTVSEEPPTETQFLSFGGGRESQNNQPQSVANYDNQTGFQLVSQNSAEPQNTPTANRFNADQIAFLNGDRHLELEHGQQLKGEILTPAIAEQGQEFLITITEGSSSLSKGSVATARIDQLYGDGLMRASIQGIVTPQGQRYRMPDGSLQLMARNGKPLIARSVRGGGLNIGNLFKSVVFGAVSNAAGRINTGPRTRFNRADGSVFEDFGQQSNNLTTNLLQGGLSGISPLIQNQQAQAQQNLSGNQSSVLFLKAGTKVVLQSF